jgi:hypothetical protein
MMNKKRKTPESKEGQHPKENAISPTDAKAGLTKEDGINAFKASQDKKHRPEDILFNNPDDIDNPEDIISG